MNQFDDTPDFMEAASSDSPDQQVADLQKVIAQKDALIVHLASGIESHKRQVVSDVVNAVERVVLPLLATLHGQLDATQRRLLETATANLKDLISPFVARLDEDLANLTPAELRICTHIRHGLSVKEIAAAEQLSPSTISTHRRSIRRKLGLARSGTNLATYLNRRPAGKGPISSKG
jgi:DNA-binding NarL/FixJ family response regulator